MTRPKSAVRSRRNRCQGVLDNTPAWGNADIGADDADIDGMAGDLSVELDTGIKDSVEQIGQQVEQYY
ncbi:MAG: hypothetical protein F6K30_25190 [Cyanothece sp. SIO2G6]|nr:hypothetical protein [Cyanothece sp. SIO2G6]